LGLAAAAALVAVVGIAVAVLVVPRTVDLPGSTDGTGAPALGTQRVVVWTLWDEKPGQSPFVAVLAAGGGLPPVAVAVPGNTEAIVPGADPSTVEDVAAQGDVGAVAATVENILGVKVDAAWGMEIQRIRPLVEQAGGIDAGFEHLDADGVIAYLREAPTVQRAIRWQEVIDGLMVALDGAELPGVPEDVRPAFVAGPREVVILPVRYVEGGLVSPVQAQVERLVRERFVPTGSAEKVRLVVLNGIGAPGIGEEVGRRLVPEGFQVVASENLQEFGVEETSIVATSNYYLDAARRARSLLGVGKVYLGTQPTSVADVFVIVGKDFVSGDAGGP
jgi:hypothetical protein